MSMLRSAVTVGSAAAACVVLAATPSLAGTDVNVYSIRMDCNLVSCGVDVANAYFFSDGDDWRVCDLEPDGDRAKMSITYVNSSGSTVIKYTEAAGGSGTCVKDGVGVDIPEGNRVTIKVWHQNGSTGAAKDVASDYGYA
ncbi:hypothetical protein [Streptomyces cadmiisoli]|uniref:Spore-associated protein A n=1 Tax=Streptomyces cadmiisoli TaxID=2184053 RepID=A0A2Z4J9B3_9ACTN|nr:hypothetical protein [Streptomyces cadmiisoli]AWW41590.1 hypothetical protein DN051_37110 [Streptomyces cadmiisoli]